MKRGAIAAREVMLLVAAIVIFVLVLGFAARVGLLIASKNEVDLCRKSLFIMDASRYYDWRDKIGQHLQAKPATTPKCPIEHLRIELPPSGKSQNKLNEIKRDIAEAMRRCWYKTGEATLDPFAAAHWDDVAYCILCAKISFSEAVQREFPQIDNFYQYIATHKMLLTERTYLEYLSPQDTDVLVYPPDESELTTLDTSKTYYLVWYYRKGGAVCIGPLCAGQKSRDNVQLKLIPVEQMPSLVCDAIFT
ncbi:hypothetical protein DRJ48_00205 [Candidatus Woesearchaeota archaeon]|nr:hypothetical protein [Candidatus Woesearchaeota archaeon]RLE43671.1 MAG: hypothetical protein DRJ48_00205 [Candidatus Woesearchaeota archaeon]